jgi:hypothetical protein
MPSKMFNNQLLFFLSLLAIALVVYVVSRYFKIFEGNTSTGMKVNQGTDPAKTGLIEIVDNTKFDRAFGITNSSSSSSGDANMNTI